jgi:flagellar basal-body rod modification protein FlgD
MSVLDSINSTLSSINSAISSASTTASTTASSVSSTVSSALGTSTTTPTTTSSSSSSSSSATVIGQQTIAGNFNTFLQLLTTQLQNQNPLDPLDTNQFTAQLVQFAGVEQQLQMNSQLSTLVSLQQTAQSTAALSFVGKTVGVDGSTAQLSNGQALWSFSVPKPASANVVIKSSTGQTVYSGSYTLQSGTQQFAWDGRDNNGALQPDGAYTLSITAVDATGQSVAISTEIDGTVDSVDLTQNPPLLSIGGQNFTLSQVKRVLQ